MKRVTRERPTNRLRRVSVADPPRERGPVTVCRVNHQHGRSDFITIEIRPLIFKPHYLNGLTERLLVSQYENNYGGALRRLDAIDPFVPVSLDAKRLFRETKDVPFSAP